MVATNHDCHLHPGEVVPIGDYTSSIYAGGARLSPACLEQTDVLVTLKAQGPIYQDFLGEGAEWLHFPMEDFGGIPPGYREFLDKLIARLADGKRLAIHCAGGFGRTGTVLASLVVLLEPDIDDPIREIRDRYCPRAVETLCQVKGIFDLKGVEVPSHYLAEGVRR
jgi:hypothetical protein